LLVGEPAAIHEVERRDRGVTEQPRGDRVAQLVEQRHDGGQQEARERNGVDDQGGGQPAREQHGFPPPQPTVVDGLQDQTARGLVVE
jgi:hypothetical protein